MFDEWQQEIDLYASAKLKRLSSQQLKRTQRRYTDLLRAMRGSTAVTGIKYVPRPGAAFKTQSKRPAIASLRNEFASIENDIASLIRDMEASIAKAFISELATDNTA